MMSLNLAAKHGRRWALRSSLQPECRVLPAARGRNSRVDLLWSPATRFVFVDGRRVLQHRIDDSPRLFDVVLSREQRGIALHAVTEDSLIRVHLVGARKPSAQHFRGLAARLIARRDDIRADGE